MDVWEGVKFDPISLHKYLYCAHDPVNKIDPSGLMNLVELNVVQTLISVVRAIGAKISFLKFYAVTKILGALAVLQGGMRFIINRGPYVIRWLARTGMRGINALQRIFSRTNVVSLKDALKSPNWSSHSAATRALNKMLHGTANNLPGQEWHHIVMEVAKNCEKFKNAVHSLSNMVSIPKHIHTIITRFQNSKHAFTGDLIFHQWIRKFSWEEQFRIGKKIYDVAMAGGDLSKLKF